MSEEQIELETKYTFLERTVSELNAVIYDQQNQIDRLEIAIKRITDRLDGDRSENDAPIDQRPPHY